MLAAYQCEISNYMKKARPKVSSNFQFIIAQAKINRPNYKITSYPHSSSGKKVDRQNKYCFQNSFFHALFRWKIIRQRFFLSKCTALTSTFLKFQLGLQKHKCQIDLCIIAQLLSKKAKNGGVCWRNISGNTVATCWINVMWNSQHTAPHVEPYDWFIGLAAAKSQPIRERQDNEVGIFKTNATFSN